MVTDIAVKTPAGLLADEQASEVLAQFTTFIEGATVIINRMPTTVERKTLSKRARDLESVIAALGSAGMGEAKKLLAQFFLGYPSLLNADAPGLITAYISDLRSVPLFALRAALDDIKHGRITVSDGKGRQMPLDKDWPPSSSRIYDIAVKISEPSWQEFTKINRVLGTVQLARPDMTDDERERVKLKIKSLHSQFTKSVATDDANVIDANQEAELRAEAERARQQQAREMEYRSAGLEPIYADEKKTIIVSLPLMLLMGHRIKKDTNGAAVLVGPTLERV
jgi:hypothetical protein